MTRITQHIREKINYQAVNTAFAEREAAMGEASHALGMEAYEASFPKAVRQQAEAMPDGWLRLDKCLRFNANGWNVTLSVKVGVPVPSAMHNCQTIAALTGDLGERVQAHKTAGEKLRSEKRAAEQEMSGFLEQFRSIKQMREAWPEGAPFYAAFETERKAANLPAIRVQKINELLNLEQAA